MTETEKFPLTETRYSNWRVVAIDVDDKEHLIFVGQSYTHVTEAYPDAFENLLESEEKAKVKGVVVQRWNGSADRGSWVNKKSLAIP